MKSGFPNSQFCSFLYGTQSSKTKLSFLALKIENEKKIYTKSCVAMNMHNSPIIDVLSWYRILFHKAAYACRSALSFGPQFCRASRLLLLGCFRISQPLASLSKQLLLSIRHPQDRSLEPHLGSQPLLPTSPPRCGQVCLSCKSSQEVVVYTGGMVNYMCGLLWLHRLWWELPSVLMWHIGHADILVPRAPVITTSPHFCKKTR